MKKSSGSLKQDVSLKKTLEFRDTREALLLQRSALATELEGRLMVEEEEEEEEEELDEM